VLDHELPYIQRGGLDHLAYTVFQPDVFPIGSTCLTAISGIGYKQVPVGVFQHPHGPLFVAIASRLAPALRTNFLNLPGAMGKGKFMILRNPGLGITVNESLSDRFVIKQFEM
jgi:hypothetical protein